jgi:hypothetical protein
VFSKLMFQGKVHAAMRFLTEEGQGSLLNITDDVLDQLKTKHQSPSEILKESLLYGPINQIQVPYLKHTFPSTKTPFLEQLAQGRHALTLISSDAFYHQITFPKKGNISERKYSLICQILLFWKPTSPIV